MSAKALLLVSLAAAVTLALAPQAAQGQRGQSSGSSQPKLYKWTDKDGNVHFSDQIPPDAAEYARERFSAQGVAVEQVDRAKTPEEIAAEAAEAKRIADAERLAEERRKSDEALLNSYASEEDLTRAFNQRIDLLEQTVEARRIEIAAREKSLADLVARAAEMERSGKAVTDTLKTMITGEREEIDRQKRFLVEREADRGKAKADYDRDVARYRAALARVEEGKAE